MSTSARGPVALAWSGGKDSALALWALREELGIEPAALLTTVTEELDRVSMHGVRRELVRAQAEAAGLPLVEVEHPRGLPNEVYEQRMAAALASPPLAAAPRSPSPTSTSRTSAPTARSASPVPAARRCSRSGAATPRCSPARSSPPASRRRWSASTRARSTPPSPAAPSTRSCWPTCPPPPTPAARTASSTPSSTPARSSTRRSRSRWARRRCATASSSPTSCPPENRGTPIIWIPRNFGIRRRTTLPCEPND